VHGCDAKQEGQVREYQGKEGWELSTFPLFILRTCIYRVTYERINIIAHSMTLGVH